MSRANSFSEKKLGGSNRIRPSDIELEDLDDSSVNDWNNPARMSPTLGELLKRVGDSTRIEGDLIPTTSSEHRVIDMNENGGSDSFSKIPTSRSVPFVLSFNNLTYSVKVPTKMKLPTNFRRKNRFGDESLASRQSTKTLLNNISGEAKDGEILAVLGASGSGKSTLIDAIANRIAKGSLKGTVTLNGEVLQSRLQKVISAYVMQDDLLYPMLTVEETLMFSAEFRLPRSLSKSKKKARVQALIDQLGLRNAANTVIGDEGHRGVSGGERRRVSIGTDIIHDPILLFLDEPTSGLDSTSAFMVIKVLQRIAQSGSIVMMSIHQPSYRILGLLDRVIFLSRGQTVFNGRPSNLPRFFEDFGHPIPENENKTEFALDFIREQEVSPAGTKSLVEFNKTWIYMNRKNSCTYSASGVDYQGLSLKEAISASISKGKLVSGATNNDPNFTSTMETFANPPWTEINVLNKRSLLNMKRMPELVGIRLGAVTITGFILATVFWHLDNSPRGLQERLGFFAFAMSTTYYTCAEALPVFLTEKFIFMRETAYNAYRRSSYVLSRAIVDLPALVLLSIAFAVITYWSVGLAGGLHGFLFFFLIILASFWAGSSFVTFLSSVISHVMVGYTVVVAVLAYFLLFSGFFMNRDRMPIYWIWFHYVSLIKYPFEAVLQNEFSDPNKCFINGAQIFDTTPLKGFPMELKEKLLKSISGTLGFELTPTTCVTTGMDILKDQGVTQLDKWTCLWITVAWGVFFRVLFYFCLLIGSKNKRR